MPEADLLIRDTQAQHLRGFACPHEEFDFSYLEEITVRHSRKIVRGFIRQYGSCLEEQGNGLVKVLQSWLDHQTNFSTTWDTSFGKAREALASYQEEPLDYTRRAAALALRLHESGLAGEWSLNLDAPTRLKWGRWLLPLADRIEVKALECAATIRLYSAQALSEVRLNLTATGWVAEGAKALPLISSPLSKLTLLWPGVPESLELEDVRPDPLVDLPEPMVESYEAGFRFLQEYAPAYLLWVTRAIQQIVPTKSPTGEVNSGSSVHLPGVLHTSYGVGAVTVADMLVHEATHQYFHLACQAGPAVDRDHLPLYYSPVLRRERPIRAILLAYHAFANVILFYRLCQANGFRDTGYCQSHEADLLPKLKQLEQHLRDNPAVTALGRTLWEPLAERL